MKTFEQILNETEIKKGYVGKWTRDPETNIIKQITGRKPRHCIKCGQNRQICLSLNAGSEYSSNLKHICIDCIEEWFEGNSHLVWDIFEDADQTDED